MAPPLEVVRDGDSGCEGEVEASGEHISGHEVACISEAVWVVCGSQSDIVWEEWGADDMLVTMNGISAQKWVQLVERLSIFVLDLSREEYIRSEGQPVGSSCIGK